MDKQLFLSEMQFIIIFIIAAWIAYEFYISRNGVLRRLMIWFFVIEAVVYFSSGLYFWLIDAGVTLMSLAVFRAIILLPKTYIMLRILYYLNNKR